MAKRYQAVAAVAKRAEWHKRESILTGVASRDDLHAAVTAGVTFVQGQAVAPLLETPGYDEGLAADHIPARQQGVRA